LLVALGGDVARQETFSGRAAILFQENLGFGLQGEWIDEKSLFPLGLILPKIPARDEPTIEPVPAREVQITSLNPTTDIQTSPGDCPPPS
jgi:hypothetical protein